MKNKKTLVLSTTLFLSLLLIGMIPTQAAIAVPLQDHISLTGYYNTAVDSTVDVNDYMLVGNYWYSSMGEAIWASDGETSAGTGTSYISLEDSCILGDYASEPNSWADYAYLKSSYGATVTKVGGDLAWVVGTNCTAPSLSAGSTSSYISLQMAGDASGTGGTAEEITFTADCWSDVDGDGVDDSATVPEEDYIAFTSNVYVYGVAMVDASDVDKDASGYIKLGFYVDSSTTYDMRIEFQGGEVAADSTYVASWTYTGATATELDHFEAEAEAIAFLVDLSDAISDDTDSSPVIAGLDWIKLGIYAEDAYGDGSSDTIDFYVYNLAIFDEIPALTDNDPSTDYDINQAANQATTGDATYYLSHNVLQPYVAAATDNDWVTKVYFDRDFKNGDRLFNQWRHIKFMGTAKKDPSSGSVSTERGTPPNVRECNYVFNFNQLRISDGDDLSSTFTPTYTAQLFKIKTENDDFYSAEKEYDDDIISASVKGVDKTDTFISALANQNDNTWVTLFTFAAVDTSGNTEIAYSYYTEETPDDLQEPIVWPTFGVPRNIGFIIGGIALLGVIALAIAKKRR